MSRGGVTSLLRRLGNPLSFIDDDSGMDVDLGINCLEVDLLLLSCDTSRSIGSV